MKESTRGSLESWGGGRFLQHVSLHSVHSELFFDSRSAVVSTYGRCTLGSTSLCLHFLSRWLQRTNLRLICLNNNLCVWWATLSPKLKFGAQIFKQLSPRWVSARTPEGYPEVRYTKLREEMKLHCGFTGNPSSSSERVFTALVQLEKKVLRILFLYRYAWYTV